MVRSLQSMLDRHVARSEIDKASRNKERRHLARSPLLHEDRGVGDSGKAADAGTDQGAGRATILLGRRMPIRIVERLLRGAHCEDDEIVDPALVLWLHPLVGIEGSVSPVAARNDAGDSARQVGNVEGFDLLRAALAVEDSFPGRLNAAA